MSLSSTVTSAPPSTSLSPSRAELVILGICLAVMYVPTYIYLDTHVWSKEGQGHGPVMLALALWLFYKRLPTLISLPTRSSWLAWPLLAFSVLLYAIGQSQELPELSTASQLSLFSGLLLAYRGRAGLKAAWFPIFFLIFIIPFPGIVVQLITGPLKAGVSTIAELLLYHAGYPIGRSGVTLTIGSYNLMVADACAGLNSIFALEAIGVFYLSIMEYKSRLRNMMIALLILPISFISNVLRVVALVLVTYYFGDEVGQGFVHSFAGIFLFMIATLFTIGTDNVLGWILGKKHSDRESADAPAA
ncbi:MAG: exosortase B [Aquabacterium sp.]